MTDHPHDGPPAPDDRALIYAAMRDAQMLRGDSRTEHASGRSRPRPEIPGYEILREIHRGGQGVIYEAVHDATRRHVAIKVLKEGLFAGDAERHRFEREVRILSRLNHPSIVVIHDSGQVNGLDYHVMDYINGVPLDAWIAGSDLTMPDLLQTFREICSAVSAAHVRGIIHRDLKPGNILIDEEDRPHLLDFGLARFETSADDDTGSGKTVTMAGQFLGSIPWASPEQANGAPEGIDVRSDVYSLGVIMYQMTTGTFPYDITGRIPDVVHNIVHAAPTRPGLLSRRIPGEVETIILKCLSKERDRRYQSASELERDIGRYLSGEAIEAKRDSMVYLLRKTIARHRLIAVAALLVLLLLGGWGITMAILMKEAQQQSMIARTQQKEAERLSAEAIRERESAEAARAMEADRARQLERVVAFQASQLAGIDAHGMGRRLREQVLHQKEQSILRTGGDQTDESHRSMGEFRLLLDGVNFTNVALASLKTDIFDRALTTIDREFNDEPLVKAQLLQSVATTLQTLGLIHPARPPQEEALRIRRKHLGEEHALTIASMARTGALYAELGLFDLSEDLLQRVLDSRRARVIASDDTLFTAMYDLATLRQMQGRYHDSIPLLEEALQGLTDLHGPLHKATLDCTSVLGMGMLSLGNLEKAQPLLTDVYNGRLRVFGRDHPDTLQAANNMAGLMYMQGRIDEAIEYLDTSLSGYRTVLGDDHPDTLTLLRNMGGLLSERGRYAESEHHFRLALEAMQRVLGDHHFETARARNDIGSILNRQGLHSEAEALFRESLAILESALGRDHPITLFTLSNIGTSLTYQKRYDEAAPYLEEVLDTRREIFGSDHPDTISSVTNLGAMLLEGGRPEAAQPLLQESAEKLQSIHGPDHPQTLFALSNIVRMQRELNMHDEAISLSADIVRRARGVLPETSWHLGHILLSRALTLAVTDRLHEAEPLMVEATGILESALGPDHARTRDAEEHLARLYTRLHHAHPADGYDERAALRHIRRQDPMND